MHLPKLSIYYIYINIVVESLNDEVALYLHIYFIHVL